MRVQIKMLFIMNMKHTIEIQMVYFLSHKKIRTPLKLYSTPAAVESERDTVTLG